MTALKHHFLSRLYLFPGAAIANCHKLGGLKVQKFILSKFGDHMFEIQVSAGLVPSWGQ